MLFDGWASSGLYTTQQLMRWVTSITWTNVFTMMVAIPVVIFLLLLIVDGLDDVLNAWFPGLKRYAVISGRGGKNLSDDPNGVVADLQKQGFVGLGRRVERETYVKQAATGLEEREVEFYEKVQQRSVLDVFKPRPPKK